MRILIVGRLGQVAWELQRELACLGEVIVVDRHTRPYAIDLLNNTSIEQTIAALKPDVIVNAAAYTAVDLAETEIEQAMQINGYALVVMAEAAKQCGALLIHYSTDYVFDGKAVIPYEEEYLTAPQSVYGQSKLVGEQAIQSSGVEHLIFRTAWVYGGRGKNFLLTMLRLMQSKHSLNIVSDQIGSPTWSRHIANVTALILAQNRCGNKIDLTGKSGIYHLTNADYTSWFGFAEKIYQLASYHNFFQHEVQLNPIDTSSYTTIAKRPAYSVLSGTKLFEQFNLTLPIWQIALEQCFLDYNS